jgi:GNAT superfamily N-acetyltransferase
VSSAEAFRGSAHPEIVDDDVSPTWFYRPHQRAGLLWVADTGDRLTGFAACADFDDGLHLWELAVRHEVQGRGTGRALVGVAVDEARRRGFAAVTLTTFRTIPWNAPFYARLGFGEVPGAALNARLAAVLKREWRHGLTDRCAMRLAL